MVTPRRFGRHMHRARDERNSNLLAYGLCWAQHSIPETIAFEIFQDKERTPYKGKERIPYFSKLTYTEYFCVIPTKVKQAGNIVKDHDSYLNIVSKRFSGFLSIVNTKTRGLLWAGVLLRSGVPSCSSRCIRDTASLRGPAQRCIKSTACSRASFD